MIIAVDAAGGDYAPYEIVKGAIKAAEEYEVEVALVGKKETLHVLAGKSRGKAGISIVEATQVIDYHEPPMKAVKNNPDSSIVVGINLLKEGKASAFVSAGSTGAIYLAALLALGKAGNVERPAIGCFLDTIASVPPLLIDAGANVDCRPHHLVQFAKLGTIYSKHILGIEAPRVGLLNNGVEELKGNRLVLDTYQLLKKANGLNFIGNIEGHDIARNAADVIVTDGFTGNVVIKTIEGLRDNFLSSVLEIGHTVSRAYHLGGRDLLHDIGWGHWAKRMDYREYGGACLLGINGNVIIAHGRSHAKAIQNAIGLAKKTAQGNIAQMIGEESYEQASDSQE